VTGVHTCCSIGLKRQHLADDGAHAPRLPNSLKLDALATDKACEGVTSPLAVCFLVVGEPPFAHPEGRFALLHAHASALQACV
jgi:hypothetical protein